MGGLAFQLVVIRWSFLSGINPINRCRVLETISCKLLESMPWCVFKSIITTSMKKGSVFISRFPIPKTRGCNWEMEYVICTSLSIYKILY
jgi:hypothetical protein